MHAFAEALAARGWAVTRIPVSGARVDVLATAGDGPYVTLSTHLDTVPPYIRAAARRRAAPRPRLVRREGNRRGDARRGGAAARQAPMPVAMLFVVGEETTHDGAHAADAWARANGFRSLALVNGEPTESTLALGTKGAMRVILRTVGEAAHSAYPHLGRSATRALVHLLAELDTLELPQDELLGETTVNIGRLEGGVADNVVAPSAEARLMARIVGPSDEVWLRLKQWIGGRAHLERSVEIPAMRLGTVPGFPTSSSHSRPTSRRCRRGGRRICSGRARSTSRIATTSTWRSLSCAQQRTATYGSPNARSRRDDDRTWSGAIVPSAA